MSLLTKMLALGLTVGTAVPMVALTASAEEAEGLIDRSVENIDNGVIITFTTDDEEALEMLQDQEKNFKPKMGMMDDVERSVENLENGVQITLTSEDPEVVEKLQNMPDKPMHGGRGPHPFEGEIEHDVEITDDGVIITLTTDNPEALEFLHNQAEEGFGFGFHGPRPQQDEPEQED